MPGSGKGIRYYKEHTVYVFSVHVGITVERFQTIFVSVPGAYNWRLLVDIMQSVERNVIRSVHYLHTYGQE